MSRRAVLLMAAATTIAAAGLAGCALFPSTTEAAAVTSAVADVPVPEGWAEVGSIEVACAAVNVDCQDSSARRVFRNDGDVAAACGGLLAYLGYADAFAGASGISGTSSAPPSTDDCAAELSAYQRYLVTAPGPDGAGEWRLRLAPGEDGFRLSVVLGDPPRDPWD